MKLSSLNLKILKIGVIMETKKNKVTSILLILVTFLICKKIIEWLENKSLIISMESLKKITN